MWIDDRNIGGLPDWGTIYQMIHYNKTWNDINSQHPSSYEYEKPKKKWWQF